MPSLQEVIERACADGAFEVVIESGHALVVASPKGRLNAGLPVTEDEIHAMLDRYLSPDQHVELALGQQVSFDLPLRGEKGAWKVVVESLPEGSVVRVTAPARPRSTGEFAASDLRRMVSSRGTPVVSPSRASPPSRTVSAAVNDEVDLDLEFDDSPPPAPPPASASVVYRPSKQTSGSATPNKSNDDLAFDDMMMQEDHGPSLAALGPLEGEEEFRQSVRSPAEATTESFALADDAGSSWEEDDQDEEFSVPGVGHRPLSAVSGDQPVAAGVPNRTWPDAASDPTPTAGVPAFIPEHHGYTPHAGLEFDDRLPSSSMSRPQARTIEFDLQPPPAGEQSENLDSLLRESTLVLALEPHVAGLVCAGLSVPSVKIEHEEFDPRTLGPRLVRLPRGSCIVLELEDPSVALGWVLRRLEQAFRVVVVARAVTMEGAQRMLLGTQSSDAARHWLAAHETFGVSYERSSLAWRALPWNEHGHVAA